MQLHAMINNRAQNKQEPMAFYSRTFAFIGKPPGHKYDRFCSIQQILSAARLTRGMPTLNRQAYKLFINDM